jgi:quercetin dioxygenase-like cupin family protein
MINKDERWIMRANVVSTQTSPGVLRAILAYNDSIMCVENQFNKGAEGAVHSHPHTQITYILSGVFEFTIGDEKRIVKIGDTLLMESDIEHGCVCIEDGAVLDVFTPMREDFI